MQHQAQQSQRNLKTIPLPTSDVTLFALDILLENTGKKFNGRELQNQVEEKLGRPINYAGLLKQLRAYATKPGWNIVLKIDPQSDHQLTSPRDLKNAQINIRTRPTLAIYAQDNVVSHKLHALMHKLNDIKEAMNIRLGRRVALASAYNLLHRHGWRKLAPDKRHPQFDIEIQEAWKKNSQTPLPKSTKRGRGKRRSD